MGCGNPPVLNPTEEEKNELSHAANPGGVDDGGWTHGANSFGADFSPLPYMSLDHSHFPQHDVQGGTHLGVSATGYPPINTQGAEANPRTTWVDGELFTDTSVLPLVDNIGVTENRYDMNTDSQIVDGNFLTLGTGYATEIRPNRSFSTREISSKLGDAGGSQGYSSIFGQSPLTPSSVPQLTGRAVNIQQETRYGTEFWPNRSFIASQGNSSIFGQSSHTPSGVPQLTGRAITIQPEPRYGTEIWPNRAFSTREISSKRGDAGAFQGNSFIFSQSPQNSSSVPQLTGRAVDIQPETGGLTSSAWNLDRMSTSGEGEVIGNTSARLNSHPVAGLQTLATAQSNFSSRSGTPWFNQVPSLPFRNTLVSEPEFVNPIAFGQGMASPTYFAHHQPVTHQQYDPRYSSLNFSSGSSRYYLSDTQRRSSVSHAQLGRLIPLEEGRETQSNSDVYLPVSVQPVGHQNLLPEHNRTDPAMIGSFPSNTQSFGHSRSSRNVSSFEAPGNSLVPDRTGAQISNNSNFMPAAAGSFPKRLGVHPSDLVGARGAKVPRHDLRPGPPPIASYPPSVASYRPPIASYQPPVASYLPQSRHTTETSPAACGSHHGNNFPQHFRRRPRHYQQHNVAAPPVQIPQQHNVPAPSLHIPQQHNVPASPVHIPPETHRIKWQGSNELLHVTGYKCLLCKRDLSFTSEGAVHQPTAPPAVAVLPCGHTFHDDCIQKITPDDESKDPPCIPCAIGET